MSVHYKFRSALEYDTVTFDGLHISVKDLKNAIVQQKRIGKNTDFDLQVTNAQTKEVYDDDNVLIPKNTSLLIARIPTSSQTKNKQWEGYGGDATPPTKLDEGGPIAKAVDLSSLDAPEGDKIKAMISQSTQDYDPSNYMKIRGANQVGAVPPNYRCYKCHQNGHWIKDCPLSKGPEPIEIKKSTGIPLSFMVPVEGPQVQGAMMTPNGSYAVPVLDHQTYTQKQHGGAAVAPVQEMKPEIPEDLLCSICADLLTDAVMIPCCGNSFCDECIRSTLLESEEHECPDCHEKDISPVTLIPNRFLRNSVSNFKNTTGYVKTASSRPMLAISTESIKAKINKDTSANDNKIETEEKTVISEADSTEPKADEKEEATDAEKSTPGENLTETLPEGPPGVSPVESPQAQPPLKTNSRPAATLSHNRTLSSKVARSESPRPPPSGGNHRTSPYSDNIRGEERPGTPTVDEPGMGNANQVYPPPAAPPSHPSSDVRPYQQPQGPPGTMPAMMGVVPQMAGPPPGYPPNQMGGYAPTNGPPPNFRLPPPGSQPPPYMGAPGYSQMPPRPMYDANRPPMGGPPPQMYNTPYQQGPGGQRPHHHHHQPHHRGDYGGMSGTGSAAGSTDRRMRGRTPSGVIDDPLAAFNRMLKEKDERERRAKRNQRRSYSRSRSRSRSYSRSPRRMRSRSPRRRQSRSRSRSFSLSRSRSRSFSGSPFREFSPRHSPPRRRGPSRYRSPVRSPPRRRFKDPHPNEHFRDRGDHHHHGTGSHHHGDGRLHDRDRDHRDYERGYSRDREHSGRNLRDERGRGDADRDYGSGGGASSGYYESYDERNRKSGTVPSAASGASWNSGHSRGPPPSNNDYYHQHQVQQQHHHHHSEHGYPPSNRYPPSSRDYHSSSSQYGNKGGGNDVVTGPSSAGPAPPQQSSHMSSLPLPAPPSQQQQSVSMHNMLIPPPNNNASMPPQQTTRRYDDDVAPPGVEEPPVPGMETAPIPSSAANRFDDRYEHHHSARNSGGYLPTQQQSFSPQRDKLYESRKSGGSLDERSKRKRLSRSRERSVSRRRSSSLKMKSKSRDRESPDSSSRHSKKKKRETNSSDRDRKSDDDKGKRSKDRKKNKKEKKDGDKKKRKEKKEKHHRKDEKEKKHKDNVDNVKNDNNDEEGEAEKKIEENKELIENVLVDNNEKSTKHSDNEEELTTETSAPIQTTNETNDEVNADQNSQQESSEHASAQLNTDFDDSAEGNILEIHPNECELDVKNEMLANMPEKSKWEVEDDTQNSPKDLLKSTSDVKLDKSGKVTNEVLKRAENAIFAKAINAIRPIEIKKISSERAKLYADEKDVVKDVDNDQQTVDEMGITTIEDDEQGKNERKVVEAPPAIVAASVSTATAPPARLSVKERLGIKVDDSNDRLVKYDRNKSRSLSPFSRRNHELSRNYGMGERRVELIERDRRGRHNTDSRRDRRDDSRHRIGRRGEYGRRDERRSDGSSRRGSDKRDEHYSSRRDDNKKRERSRSKGKQQRDRDGKRGKSSDSEDRKSKSHKKKEKKVKKEKSSSDSKSVNNSKKEDKGAGVDDAAVTAGKKDKKKEDEKVVETKKIETKHQQQQQRKPTIDEASFEPDYDLESESDKEDKKKDVAAETTIAAAAAATSSAATATVAKKSSSSSDSSSSSSDDDNKKRKKHKKHKNKKKSRKDSSSSSSESESDSSDDDKDRKRKKHKKKTKKRKKSKHK